MRFYAIGDIHGQREKLRAAHSLVRADRVSTGDTDAPLIHLGDHTDRGPDSRGVIDDLIAGMAAGQPWQSIRGNHDQMFLDFLSVPNADDPRFGRADWWLQPNLGGPQTLASYGVDVPEDYDFFDVQARARVAVPEAHVSFLDQLPLYAEMDHFLCVHAGIRPGIPLEKQEKEDLIWIRDDFLWDERDHPKPVVHGHTAVQEPENHRNRVNLDTGAGYGRKLTAAVFEGGDVWILTEDGRVPLPPL